nr:FMN-binding protein [Lachnospiraceae bacterium]
DDQFFNRAKSTIINEVVSSQSVNVDTVSGATYSSQGLLEAIANALNVD